MGMENHRLAFGGLERDDRAAAHFAPGPGRRRDADEGSKAGPDGFVIKLRQIEAGALHQQTRGFADIQRAAPAQGDETIAFSCNAAAGVDQSSQARPARCAFTNSRCAARSSADQRASVSRW